MFGMLGMLGMLGRSTLFGMRGHPGTAGSRLASLPGVFRFLEDLAAVTGRAILLRALDGGDRPCRLATAGVPEAVGSRETLQGSL